MLRYDTDSFFWPPLNAPKCEKQSMLMFTLSIMEEQRGWRKLHKNVASSFLSEPSKKLCCVSAGAASNLNEARGCTQAIDLLLQFDAVENGRK